MFIWSVFSVSSVGVSGQDDSNVTGCSDDEEDDEEATKRLIRQVIVSYKVPPQF